MHLCEAELLAETLKLTISSTTLLQLVPVLNSNLARFSIRSKAYPDHIISVSIHLQIYELLERHSSSSAMKDGMH